MIDNEIVWYRWNKNAEKCPEKEAIIHWKAGYEPYRWTFSSLISKAEKFSFL